MRLCVWLSNTIVKNTDVYPTTNIYAYTYIFSNRKYVLQMHDEFTFNGSLEKIYIIL